MSTLALVKDCRAFIGTAQLLCIEAHFLPSALFAGLSDNGMCLHIFIGDSLHLGAFAAEH